MSLYERGIDVLRNFTKTLEWYSLAADAGEKEAYMHLGTCWEIGMGTTADMGKAVTAFEKAAALGHIPAQHRLAKIFLNGRGLPKDEAKGFALLRKAAEAGDISAAFDLGQALLAGSFGCKADPQQARVWLLKAAEAGHPGAALSLAALLKDDVDGRADQAGALRWFLIAQKTGLRSRGLAAVIGELRAKLPESQTREVEKTVDAWIAARIETGKQLGAAGNLQTRNGF